LNLVGGSDIAKLMAVNLKTTSFPSLAPRERGSGHSEEENDLKTYQKKHRSVVPKMKALWKAQSFSTLAAQKIKEHLGKKFIIHNKTRWNSSFTAVQRIVELSEKKKEAFESLCKELKVATFGEDDLRFMWEYVHVSSLKLYVITLL
jgi:hypothetical protein